MTKKADIFKTFEIFNRETLSILRDRLVEIVLIETDNIFSKANKKLFEVDFKKNNSLQISVFNDKPMYDLLANTWRRKQQLRQCEEDSQSPAKQLPGLFQ